MVPTELPKRWDMDVDVVIVGAGGAGIAAAVEAAGAGCEVVVLEVMEDVFQSGTATCGGVVMGTGTSVQKAAGVQDSLAEFEKYLDAVSGGFADMDLTRTWARKSGETVEWLLSLGVKFPLEHLYVSGVEREFAHVTPPVARGHITDVRSGKPIVAALYRTAVEKGARFFFRTHVTRLVQHEGEVLGVLATQEGKTMAIKARRGVVLASAGFSRNKDLIQNYMPKMMTGGSFGSPWQRGDGIVLGQAVGAALINMWIPQAAVVGVETTPEMTPCMVITIWGSPCVMVGKDGRRHFREDLYYEFLYDKVAEQEDGFVWTLWDQTVTDLGSNRITVPAFSADLLQEIEKGWIKKADTLEELAEQIGLDASTLEHTLRVYNENVAAGKDTEFGKEIGLGPVAKPPFYAVRSIPATCDTAGGLKINSQTQVLNPFGEALRRLYAAGSTTGGWRGKIYPGSGTAVSVAVTFGRIAGQQVATEKPWA